jgi:hypothetical protein
VTEKLDPPAPDVWLSVELVDPGWFLMHVPDDAFFRVLPDESRGGWPASLADVFWITPPVFHILRVDGFTLEGADGTDERSVLSHDRISLEVVDGYEVKLEGELGGPVSLIDGRTVDVPVALLHRAPSVRPWAHRGRERGETTPDGRVAADTALRR